ncbi:MAG: hypothetical protein KDG54_12185 [Geminicoccaceae bacterium]|nr:hypothetical protein [Geminicoccaceae bacterium]
MTRKSLTLAAWALVPLQVAAGELDPVVYWNLPLSGEPSWLTVEVSPDGIGAHRLELAGLALDGSRAQVMGLDVVGGDGPVLGADVSVSLMWWGLAGIAAGATVAIVVATDSVCLSYNGSCDDDDDDRRHRDDDNDVAGTPRVIGP